MCHVIWIDLRDLSYSTKCHVATFSCHQVLTPQSTLYCLWVHSNDLRNFIPPLMPIINNNFFTIGHLYVEPNSIMKTRENKFIVSITFEKIQRLQSWSFQARAPSDTIFVLFEFSLSKYGWWDGWRPSLNIKKKEYMHIQLKIF